MKRLLTSAVLLCMAILLSLSTAVAQDVEFESSFLMFNQHKCEDLAGVMELTRTTTGPVLNELEDEGIISAWGVLTHSWGDEWNYNFWMVTEDHASFVEAWGEFGSRVNERDPDWFTRFGPMCQEHKDNLYTLHTPE